MQEVHKWHNDLTGKKLVENLKKNLFDAYYFEDESEVSKYIMNYVGTGTKIGFGGSVTVQSLNIAEQAREKGAVILDHNDASLTQEEKMDILRQQLTSDIFISSTNAITASGELVNIDGVGNRVSAMSFGPKKVIIVVGLNKLCKDVETAFERIKMEAAPKNMKRLGFLNPCIKTGYCVNCDAETRACRIYSVIKRRPMLTDMTVIVVGKSLGF
ncbi:Fe-S-cluster containining protein [Methanococcus maripaludis]|uniref:Fe-S-cluster containining protein n=1 Tax=Methanococcus maripaludis TaxID=39152 RepID=A0A7J9P0S8_METMI|nr:lactate utilization protein [Methanococcus maripaludis]MBA2853044.1 Fe-S-cluster containining protein [Methanococcus maripaludis]